MTDSRRSRLPRTFLAVEPLESRITPVLSPNIRLTDFFFVDGENRRLEGVPNIGEQVFVRAEWTTTDMVGSTYQALFTFDGIPLNTGSFQGVPGGSIPNGATVGGWYADPGEHVVQVDFFTDATQTTTDDDQGELRFVPASATTLPQQFILPIGGEPFEDWSIARYVDVQRVQAGVSDFRGGPYSINNHSGIDFFLANRAAIDQGVPVFAAANGIVNDVSDGVSDRTGNANNYVRIEHGNGWETLYEHLAAGSITVRPGQSVTAGETIGLVGAGSGTIVDLGGPVGIFPDTPVVEQTPNDSFAEAMDLSQFAFSLQPNGDIAFSTTIPHLTVLGTGDGTYDYYRIDAQAGDTLIIDIDNGSVPGSPGSFDSEVAVYDSFGFLIGFNDDSPISAGGGGSVSVLDSYLELTIPSDGVYFIEIRQFPNQPVRPGATYTMHVSLGQPVLTVPEPNDSGLQFSVLRQGRPVEPFFDPSVYFVDSAILPYQNDRDPSALDFGITNTDPTPDLEERPSEILRFPGTATTPAFFWARLSHLRPGDSGQVTWRRPDGSTEFAEDLTPPAGVNVFPARIFTLDAERFTGTPGTWEAVLEINGRAVAVAEFDVLGPGMPGEPEIRVREDGVLLLDGRTNSVNFGTNILNEPGFERTFAIENHGFADLRLSDLSIPEGFSLVGVFPAVVPPGGFDTFTVRADTRLPGPYFGEVRFFTNDLDENVYNFLVESFITRQPDPNAPVLTGLGTAIPYAPGSGPRIIDPFGFVSDFDSFDFAGGRLVAQFFSNETLLDRLAIRDQGAGVGQIGVRGSEITFGGVVIGTFTGGRGFTPLVVELSEGATPPALTALLRNLTYQNTSPNLITNPRFIRIELIDETGLRSDRSVRRVTFTERNQIDDQPPGVVAVNPVTPTDRDTPVDFVDVVLSEPVRPESFTFTDVVLTRDRSANLITPGVGIEFLTNTTYRIHGLAPLTDVPGEYRLTVNGGGLVDLAGNLGTGGASTSWVRRDQGPDVIAIDPVASPRPVPLSEVIVTLREEADPTTFTFEDVRVTRDGGNNLVTADVFVASLGGGRYRLTGFEAFTALDGEYTLTVDSRGIADFDGTPGANELSITFVVDATGPVGVDITTVEPNPRNTPVTTLQVTFSKPIDFSSISPFDFELRRDGGANLLTTATVVTPVDATTVLIQNLAPSSAREGNYTFTFFTSRITDPLGNPGVGEISTSWVMDLTGPTPRVEPATGQLNPAPGTPVRFTVTFDEPVIGFEASDLVLGGTALPRAATIIELVPGQVFTVEVGNLVRPGTVTLSIAAGAVTDLAGNLSVASVGDNVIEVTSIEPLPTPPPPGVPPPPPPPGVPPPPPPGVPPPPPPGVPPGATTSTFAVSGPDQIQVFEGGSGSPIFTLFPSFGNARVAVGDVTGDGVPDVVAAAGPGGPPLLEIFSGVDGSLIGSIMVFEESFTGGLFVALADFDGDGIADIIATPDEGGGPRVRIFNRIDGSVLADFFGIEDPNFRGGARVGVGDLNGDGQADLIVGAGFGGGPRVAVFDGTTIASDAPRKLFNDFFVFEQTLRNGVFPAAADLTGDGFADLIFGAGPGGAPRVFGVDGSRLLASGGTVFSQVTNFFAGDPNARGGVRITVKEIDGDGRPDLITAAGDGGLVSIYAGSGIPVDGVPALIEEFAPFGPDVPGGVFVG